MTVTTYTNLLTMIANNTLTVGEEYRITDYVTQVVSDYNPSVIDYDSEGNFRSAGHQFDIIVTAIGTGNISNNARAAQHSGDTYFTADGIAQWQLYYVTDASIRGHYDELSNTPWAPDKDNGGKGAILWMRDEYGNEAGYDFKNIQFRRRKIVNAPALRQDMSDYEDFYNELNTLYENAGYAGNDKLLLLHNYNGYAIESDIYNYVEDFGGNWGNIYTLSSNGTRMFCVIGSTDDTAIICLTSGEVWMYTFSLMNGINDTPTDASLAGGVNNCQMSQCVIDDYNVLPSAVVIINNTQTPNGLYVTSNHFYNLTFGGDVNGAELDGEYISCLFDKAMTGVVVNAEYSDTMVCANDLANTFVNAESFVVTKNTVKELLSLTFKSIDDKTYTIFVYGTTDEASIQETIIVAADAITIQEKNDNNMFVELRTQSGYLYITGAALSTLLHLIPTTTFHRPLIIRENGTLIWSGFLKPQQFNLKFTIPQYDRIALPLICQLGAIEGDDFIPYIENRYTTIGRVILLIISHLGSHTPYPIKNVCFDYGEQMIGNTQYVAGSDAWLQAVIQPSAFQEIDSDGVMIPSFSMQDVLKNLCVFLGYTCRTDSDTLYFLAMDDSSRGRNLRKVTLVQLLNIVNNTYTSGTAVTIQQKNIFGTSDDINRYASTSNAMIIKDGYKDAVVQCKQSSLDLSFEWPADEIVSDTTPTTTKVWDDITGGYIYKFLQATTYTKSTKDAVYQSNYMGNGWYLLVFDEDTNSEYGNPDTKAVVRCDNPYAVSGNTVIYNSGALRLRTKNQFVFNNCIIAVNCKLNHENLEGVNIEHADIYIRIGTYYRTASVSFKNGSVMSNRPKYGTDVNYDGYGFKIDSSTIPNGKDFLYGNLEVGILHAWYSHRDDGSWTVTYPKIEISDLTATVIPNVRQKQTFQEEYRTKAMKNGSELSKSTDFIKGDKNSPLTNFISGVESFISSSESDTEYNSCQYMSQRMASYYDHGRKLYKLEIKRSLINAKPTDIFIDSPDGALYTPISIENDYREDVQKLILAEIDN